MFVLYFVKFLAVSRAFRNVTKVGVAIHYKNITQMCKLKMCFALSLLSLGLDLFSFLFIFFLVCVRLLCMIISWLLHVQY